MLERMGVFAMNVGKSVRKMNSLSPVRIVNALNVRIVALWKQLLKRKGTRRSTFSINCGNRLRISKREDI